VSRTFAAASRRSISRRRHAWARTRDWPTYSGSTEGRRLLEAPWCWRVGGCLSPVGRVCWFRSDFTWAQWWILHGRVRRKPTTLSTAKDKVRPRVRECVERNRISRVR